MSDFRKYMERQMQDPAFQAEHDKTRTEFEITRALIAARVSQNLTQKELSARTGIRQSNISRIENGKCSPNLETLIKLAKGLNKKIQIQII